MTRRRTVSKGVTRQPEGVWAADDYDSFDYDEQIAEGVVVGTSDMPDWRFTMNIALDGRITKLCVERDAGVTVRGLREAPIAAMHLEARRSVARELGRFARRQGDGVGMSTGLADQFDDWGDQFAEQPRPGRAGRDLRDYAAFAAEYVALCKSSDTPLRDLATKHHISDASARGRLYEARRRGVLGPSPAGRAGGELTKLGRDLLEKGND